MMRGSMMEGGHPSAAMRSAGKLPLKSLSSASLGSLGHHHLDELFVVDLPIAVDISLADHLVHLLIGELFPEIGHDMAKLCCTDEAIAIAIEHLESLDELLLRVRVLHLTRHERQKLWKIDGAIAIGVHLVDHVLQLGLRRILAQRPHDRAQLLGGDGAITILVEEGEGLLELSDLLLGKLISHEDGKMRSKKSWGN